MDGPFRPLSPGGEHPGSIRRQHGNARGDAAGPVEGFAHASTIRRAPACAKRRYDQARGESTPWGSKRRMSRTLIRSDLFGRFLLSGYQFRGFLRWGEETVELSSWAAVAARRCESFPR